MSKEEPEVFKALPPTGGKAPEAVRKKRTRSMKKPRTHNEDPNSKSQRPENAESPPSTPATQELKESDTGRKDEDPNSESQRLQGADTNAPPASLQKPEHSDASRKDSEKGLRETRQEVGVAEARANKWKHFRFVFLFVVPAIYGFLTLLVITFQTWIYRGQLGEMRESNRVATKAADAATKAAEAAESSIGLAKNLAHLDQRAWVAPMAFGGKPEIDKPFSVTVKVQNTGKTFARKVILVFAVEEVRDEKGPNFARAEQFTSEEPAKSVQLIAPNAVVTATRSLMRGEKLTAEDMRQIGSGEVQAFAFGKIVYTDIFDSQHWTTFCYKFYPAIGGFAAYHQYNEADNDSAP